jgi:hypothetical protein
MKSFLFELVTILWIKLCPDEARELAVFKTLLIANKTPSTSAHPTLRWLPIRLLEAIQSIEDDGIRFDPYLTNIAVQLDKAILDLYIINTTLNSPALDKLLSRRFDV